MNKIQSTQSKFITRSQTCDIEHIRKNRQPVIKRYQGNSQFIRSKFDVDYAPKFRVIKGGKSPYRDTDSARQVIERQKLDELALLCYKMQEQIKNGRKIVIDWNNQQNFRTTLYKGVEQGLTRSRRSMTEESDMKNSRKSDKSDYLAKFLNVSHDKQISSKSSYLRNLIAKSVFEKKMFRDRIKKKNKRFQTQENIYYPSENPSTQFSFNQIQPSLKKRLSQSKCPTIQEVKKKQKIFFEENNEKISKAINYEKMINNPIMEQTQISKKKMRLQQVHERIICKSKLALLKSQLAKKFKQIRDSIFDEPLVPQKNGQKIVK